MTSIVPPYTFEGLRSRSNEELIELWYTLDPPSIEELDGEYKGCLIPPLSVIHSEFRKVEYGLYLGVIHTNTITDYYGPVNPNTGRSAPHPFLLQGPLYAWHGVDDQEIEIRK